MIYAEEGGVSLIFFTYPDGRIGQVSHGRTNAGEAAVVFLKGCHFFHIEKSPICFIVMICRGW